MEYRKCGRGERIGRDDDLGVSKPQASQDYLEGARPAIHGDRVTYPRARREGLLER